MMIALCDLRMPAFASAWRICGSARPPNPNAPILMKLRRETPSQNRDLLPWMVSMSADQLPHGLVTVHQELRATREIVHRDFAHVDPEVVVERREYFSELHRAFHRFTTEPVRRANHLADLHSSTILINGGRAAKFTPHDYGHILLQPASV